MTADAVVSKDALLEALGTSRDEVLAIVRALPPARLEEGRYENGWNGRQILAHLASIEWTYPRLLDLARSAAAPEAAAPQGAIPDAASREAVASSSGASELPTRSMRGGNDAYNDRQVAKRAHLSVATLLEEFEANRAATIRAVEGVEPELLLQPIRSAGGRVGPLAQVFHDVAVSHVLGHARDIVGGGEQR